jgi:hypothetical protein
MPRYRRKHKVPLEFINPNLKAVMDAVKLKKASVAYRYELLLHQHRINYQNEKERIDGIIHNHSSKLPESSIKRLELRSEKLQKMINEDLYPNRS